MSSPLNVFSNEYRSKNTVDEVANMLGHVSKSERKRILRNLKQTKRLSEKATHKISQGVFEEYQSSLDENMRRFFSVLGIVLAKEYNYEESEEKEEISGMFDYINKYLEEYRNLTTDEVAKKCFEVTGLELIAEK